MVTDNRGDIFLSAEPLGLGETVRVQCVRCQSNTPTLTITKKEDGTIVWNCYRAMCDERGARGSRGVVTRARPQQVPEFRPYEGQLRVLHQEEQDFLLTKVGFDSEHLRTSGVRWDVDQERYAFPIRSHSNQRRGWVLRSWDNLVRTKALTHMERDEPHMAWYVNEDALDTVVVVEDVPSAVRASRYVTAAALCGTGAGNDYANELAEHADHVLWALDEDAVQLSLRYNRQYGAMFETSNVILLNMDLKDMPEHDIEELLGVYYECINT